MTPNFSTLHATNVETVEVWHIIDLGNSQNAHEENLE